MSSKIFPLAILTAAILFGSGCKEKKEAPKQDLKSLFDTTPEPLRNSEHFHTVEIKQMKFVPENIKVHAGDTIAWINNDIVVHDITEEKNKEWTSSPLPIGSTWRRVIDKSADYFCSIHVVMKGKIVVE